MTCDLSTTQEERLLQLGTNVVSELMNEHATSLKTLSDAEHEQKLKLRKQISTIVTAIPSRLERNVDWRKGINDTLSVGQRKQYAERQELRRSKKRIILIDKIVYDTTGSRNFQMSAATMKRLATLVDENLDDSIVDSQKAEDICNTILDIPLARFRGVLSEDQLNHFRGQYTEVLASFETVGP